MIYRFWQQSFLLFFLIVIITSISFPVHAQQATQSQVKTILDYKDDLKLTGDQVEKIKSYMFDLQKEIQNLTVKLNAVNTEILKLLDQGAEKQGSLKLSEVEAKIREAHQVRADMAIAEIRTAEKINRILTVEQYEKWKKLTKEQGGKK